MLLFNPIFVKVSLFTHLSEIFLFSLQLIWSETARLFMLLLLQFGFCNMELKSLWKLWTTLKSSLWCFYLNCLNSIVYLVGFLSILLSLVYFYYFLWSTLWHLFFKSALCIFLIVIWYVAWLGAILRRLPDWAFFPQLKVFSQGLRFKKQPGLQYVTSYFAHPSQYSSVAPSQSTVFHFPLLLILLPCSFLLFLPVIPLQSPAFPHPSSLSILLCHPLCLSGSYPLSTCKEAKKTVWCGILILDGVIA